jgi:hypothetical protein
LVYQVSDVRINWIIDLGAVGPVAVHQLAPRWSPWELGRSNTLYPREGLSKMGPEESKFSCGERSHTIVLWRILQSMRFPTLICDSLSSRPRTTYVTSSNHDSGGGSFLEDSERHKGSR